MSLVVTRGQSLELARARKRVAYRSLDQLERGQARRRPVLGQYSRSPRKPGPGRFLAAPSLSLRCKTQPLAEFVDDEDLALSGCHALTRRREAPSVPARAQEVCGLEPAAEFMSRAKRRPLGAAASDQHRLSRARHLLQRVCQTLFGFGVRRFAAPCAFLRHFHLPVRLTPHVADILAPRRHPRRCRWPVSVLGGVLEKIRCACGERAKIPFKSTPRDALPARSAGRHVHRCRAQRLARRKGRGHTGSCAAGRRSGARRGRGASPEAGARAAGRLTIRRDPAAEAASRTRA